MFRHWRKALKFSRAVLMEIWLQSLLQAERRRAGFVTRCLPETSGSTLALPRPWHIFHLAGGEKVFSATFMPRVAMPSISILRKKSWSNAGRKSGHVACSLCETAVQWLASVKRSTNRMVSGGRNSPFETQVQQTNTSAIRRQLLQLELPAFASAMQPSFQG